MKMDVHGRKFALCLKVDEQLVVDDRNNNLKNGQIIEKQHTLTQENNNKKPSVTQWSQMDELREKFQNNEPNMEKHFGDTHSNDSHASGPIETIKNNTVINFSVESILNGSQNWTKKSDTEIVNHKSFEKVSSPQRSTAVQEDCSRIFRPMPMRYVSNSTLYHGKE